MNNQQTIHQPNLFDENAETVEVEQILLFALGDFQSRGKVLAERELALDRLRGAFKRATEKFGMEEFSDEKIAEGLARLNAKIIKVPSFVAKHPFRVIVSNELAEQSNRVYQNHQKND